MDCPWLKEKKKQPPAAFPPWTAGLGAARSLCPCLLGANESTEPGPLRASFPAATLSPKRPKAGGDRGGWKEQLATTGVRGQRPE